MFDDSATLVVEARNVREAWAEMDGVPGQWELVTVDAGYYMFARNATQEYVEAQRDLYES